MSAAHEPQRVFLCYPCITIVADDERKASEILCSLERFIEQQSGVDTYLAEECYERFADGHDEGWVPLDIPAGQGGDDR